MRLSLVILKKLFDAARAKHKEALFAANSIYRLYEPAPLFGYIFGNYGADHVFTVDHAKSLFRNGNDLSLAAAQTKHFHFRAGGAIWSGNIFRRKEGFPWR